MTVLAWATSMEISFWTSLLAIRSASDEYYKQQKISQQSRQIYMIYSTLTLSALESAQSLISAKSGTIKAMIYFLLSPYNIVCAI